MQTDTFNLDEGEVVLIWPKQFSTESLEDFEGWIELILRRARRSIIAEQQSVEKKNNPGIENETAPSGPYMRMKSK